jgi:tetratricopeptide (TPR) repeat protein
MKMQIACPKCGIAPASPSPFCPNCGWDQAKPFVKTSAGPKGALAVFVLGIALWGSAWSLQTSRAGTKPTEPYRPDTTIDAESAFDAELQTLRAEAQKEPVQMAALKAYSLALLQRIGGNEKPPVALVFEATDVLGLILRIDPQDKEGLIALADLSFNQKVFDKAVLLYQRYLAINGSDLQARARYASALAFVGKSKEAIDELNAVLKIAPDDFHALAYLAITDAQTGDTKTALSIGRKALEKAPSAETSSRFQDFLYSLEHKKSEKEPSPLIGKGGSATELAAYISQNPVAGPKYVRFESPSEHELKVYFHDFPMEAMPPFAKEKFFSGIQEKANELRLVSLERVIFIDANSGKTLATLALRARK